VVDPQPSGQPGAIASRPRIPAILLKPSDGLDRRPLPYHRGAQRVAPGSLLVVGLDYLCDRFPRAMRDPPCWVQNALRRGMQERRPTRITLERVRLGGATDRDRRVG
jgi:hypothetical protein